MSDEHPDVDDETNDERPHAEKNFGLFLNPGGPTSDSGFLMPGPLSVGPGKPGPGDEWHMPAGPVETEQDVVLEPVQGAVTEAEPRDRDKR
jgi:hypothetical protein